MCAPTSAAIRRARSREATAGSKRCEWVQRCVGCERCVGCGAARHQKGRACRTGRESTNGSSRPGRANMARATISRRDGSATAHARAQLPGLAPDTNRHAASISVARRTATGVVHPGRTHVRADARARQAIHQAYLRNTKSINNWDLVDSSAAQIVGAHLADSRSTTAAPARPLEICMGAAHRDDRDVSLHPAG